MIVGQKVVCVDDRFDPVVAQFYTALPKKDVTYVVRAVSVGIEIDGTVGEVCVHLIGLHNPRSRKPPFPERGFKAERFRPLEEIQGRDEAVKETFIPAPAIKG